MKQAFELKHWSIHSAVTRSKLFFVDLTMSFLKASSCSSLLQALLKTAILKLRNRVLLVHVLLFHVLLVRVLRGGKVGGLLAAYNDVVVMRYVRGHHEDAPLE